jgi:hypothetical protein
MWVHRSVAADVPRQRSRYLPVGYANWLRWTAMDGPREPHRVFPCATTRPLGYLLRPASQSIVPCVTLRRSPGPSENGQRSAIESRERKAVRWHHYASARVPARLTSQGRWHRARTDRCVFECEVAPRRGKAIGTQRSPKRRPKPRLGLHHPMHQHLRTMLGAGHRASAA